MATKPKTASAEVEAQIEKYRPRSGADEPARGGTLWHLNTHGLLGEALSRERDQHDGPARSTVSDGLVITRQTAWEVMAEAQRNGVTF